MRSRSKHATSSRYKLTEIMSMCIYYAPFLPRCRTLYPPLQATEREKDDEETPVSAVACTLRKLGPAPLTWLAPKRLPVPLFSHTLSHR